MSQLKSQFKSRLFELGGFFDRYILTPAAAHPRRAVFLAGAVLPLAYPPFFLLPIFYLSYGLVFWLAMRALNDMPNDAPLLASFHLAVLGWCFGFGQFLTGLLWIGEAFLVEAELFLWALPFAVTGLPAGLALFTGLAFALCGLTWRFFRPPHQGAPTSNWPALIWLALLLAAVEFARGHILTGLPWNLPLMGWAGWLYLAQPVALIGPYGLSLMALLSAALLTAAFTGQHAGQHAGQHEGQLMAANGRVFFCALCLPVLALLYAFYALNIAPPPQQIDDLNIAIIQPNLDQKEKWDPDLRDAHIEKTFSLTALALQLAPDTDLLVWPETAIPALIDEGPGFADLLTARLPQNRTQTGAQNGAQERGPLYLLTGAIRRSATVNGFDYYNSAQIWSARGLLLARSDKHHLVPFGEYLPLQGFLEKIGLQQLTKLRGGYSAGPPQAVLSTARLPLLAPLICYEAVFPHLARHQTDGAARPAALFNLTNDGWFGTSFGPHQHLAQARLRAIEQGLPLMRAANTGISAAFDARGRLIDRLALAEKGVLTLRLPASLPPTFYGLWGEMAFWLLWLSLAIFVWAIGRRRM